MEKVFRSPVAWVVPIGVSTGLGNAGGAVDVGETLSASNNGYLAFRYSDSALSLNC
jgi:hypothetical protein